MMALGDFRFIVPTFSIDTMEDTVGSRVARQEVQGSAPITHLLGPDTDVLTWESTFFPLHMNKGGPLLLAALQAACRAQTALPLMSIQNLVGLPLGRWIITSVGNSRSQLSVTQAQVIKTSISLERYVRQGQARTALGIFG